MGTGTDSGGAPGNGSGDARFLGSVPDVYERLLVPMIFEEPALRLAKAVAQEHPRTVLETAAGTGALTRALVRECVDATVVATDLNQPMLDTAQIRTADDGRVAWRRADALDLPFDDDVFDAAACQFGVMFFRDRVLAHREVSRVLRPGGTLHLTVWDRIEVNEVPYVVAKALSPVMSPGSLGFMARTPHGYHDPERIRSDLEQAGMQGVTVTAVDGTSRTTAADAALAFCQGTPMRGEIEDHPDIDVDEATRVAEGALLRHFGEGRIEAPIRWFEVRARAPGRSPRSGGAQSSSPRFLPR